MQKKIIQDRIRGCLLAGAMGDALGYAVEFHDEAFLREEFGPEGIRAYRLGTYTGKAVISDDTQMTIFTAAGILRAKEKPLRASVADAYQDWLVTQERSFDSGQELIRRGYYKPYTDLLTVEQLYARRAPGGTCLMSLQKLREKGCPADLDFIAHPLNHSKGCGGVMRVAPAAYLPKLSLRDIAVEAAQYAAVTHSHPLGWLPAAVLAVLVNRMTFTDQPLRQILQEAEDTVRGCYEAWPETAELFRLLDRSALAAENGADDLSNLHSLGDGWMGEEALADALYCALRYENDLSACLIAAVNHRGDSDSVGAIAGNILGARLGYAAIDEKWKTDLQFREELLLLADKLTRYALSEPK